MRNLIEIVENNSRPVLEADEPDMGRRGFLGTLGKGIAAAGAIAAGVKAGDAQAQAVDISNVDHEMGFMATEGPMYTRNTFIFDISTHLGIDHESEFDTPNSFSRDPLFSQFLQCRNRDNTSCSNGYKWGTTIAKMGNVNDKKFQEECDRFLWHGGKIIEMQWKYLRPLLAGNIEDTPRKTITKMIGDFNNTRKDIIDFYKKMYTEYVRVTRNFVAPDRTNGDLYIKYKKNPMTMKDVRRVYSQHQLIRMVRGNVQLINAVYKKNNKPIPPVIQKLLSTYYFNENQMNQQEKKELASMTSNDKDSFVQCEIRTSLDRFDKVITNNTDVDKIIDDIGPEGFWRQLALPKCH